MIRLLALALAAIVLWLALRPRRRTVEYPAGGEGGWGW